MSEHLTVPNPELQRLINVTVRGMAHWATSGPPDKHCGECAFYTMVNIGAGKGPRCQKYRILTGKWGTTKLPIGTPSCKYFEEIKPKVPDA